MVSSEATARVVVITGPTATGKTAAAIAIARRFGGELIGADSVQIHRGFDVGSGKATPDELGGVPHHLLDVLAPEATIDAARFADLADAAIDQVYRRGKVPIVVGGTPLWARALVRGLMPLPPSDPAIRARLLAEVASIGAPALHERLARVDPGAAAKIHPNDAVRITRALEIFEQTGEPAGALRAQHDRGAPRRPTWLAVIDLPRAEHDAAIVARIDGMIAQGFQGEVAALLAQAPGARALGSVGYAQMQRVVRGERTLAEGRAEAIAATRRYARHQRTWWKSEPDVAARTSAADLIAGVHDAAISAFLAGGVK